jgi:hypothetical protein
MSELSLTAENNKDVGGEVYDSNQNDPGMHWIECDVHATCIHL